MVYTLPQQQQIADCILTFLKDKNGKANTDQITWILSQNRYGQNCSDLAMRSESLCDVRPVIYVIEFSRAKGFIATLPEGPTTFRIVKKAIY
jgi:hypothetical protein